MDYEDPAAVWSTGILALLAAEQASAISSVASPSKTTGGTQQANNSVYSKRNPFPATVIDNIVLSGRGSTRETHHIEISLADSGLTYEPGDALGIAAHNDPAMVEALLAALNMNPDAPLTVKGQTTTLFDALGKSFEITTATLRFLDHWGELTGTTDIFSAMDNTKRAAFLHDNHIIDIIRAYPLKGP